MSTQEIDQVAAWLRSATPGQLKDLAGKLDAETGATPLLIASYESVLRNTKDTEVRNLGLEIDDILRRYTAENASPRS